ncbi:hypothetical protein B0H14DRAFT_2627325 [Mycena olivaceomarginata]|nr:hypothetical protein B0H14DRAFT_2627325 [Mycena olivaceomarginata]
MYVLKWFKSTFGRNTTILISDKNSALAADKNFRAAGARKVERTDNEPQIPATVSFRVITIFSLQKPPAVPDAGQLPVQDIRITGVDDTSETSGDVNMEASQAPGSAIRIRLAGFPPFKDPYWALDRAVLVQRNHKDVDGGLIAPHESNDKLTEGTLVLVQLKFVTYIMTDQKTEKGEPMQDKKIYHILVDRLRILDHGDGEPWYPPVPTIPERRYGSSQHPPKRELGTSPPMRRSIILEPIRLPRPRVRRGEGAIIN